MKTLLICPSERPDVQFLAKTCPLAASPVLGQGVLEYWLSYLACQGIKSVLVLADDRPDQIAAIVGDGARWGLEAKVAAESRELSPEEALLKYAADLESTSGQSNPVVLDHLPGAAQAPLFTSYADWFTALLNWMPHALTPDRVGVRSLSPGTWVGLHSQVSPKAELVAPCWIGRNVFVGARSVIGPGTVIEDGAFIEPDVTLASSLVGPDTFVGRFSQITHSLAWSSTLLDWQNGSATEVRAPFLLCSLRQPRQQRTGKWLERISELYTRNKEELSLRWKDLVMHKEG